MSRFVVDTNVPIVANGRADAKRSRQPSDEARLQAIGFLERVLANGRILMDAEGAVQAEYHRHLNPRGQPGALLRRCGITVHFVCGTDTKKWWAT